MTIRLGDGNDTLRQGSPGRDAAYGEGGNDLLVGREGDDLIDGGPGNDTLEDPEWTNCSANGGATGADTIVGGDGTDELKQICRTSDQSVTLDGQANDGGAGEGDNVAGDIEIIEGPGSDYSLNFVGNDLPNTVNGGGRPSTLIGNGGDDKLYGGVDNDSLDGGPGDDTVEGWGGADTVDGGVGSRRPQRRGWQHDDRRHRRCGHHPRPRRVRRHHLVRDARGPRRRRPVRPRSRARLRGHVRGRRAGVRRRQAAAAAAPGPAARVGTARHTTLRRPRSSTPTRPWSPWARPPRRSARARSCSALRCAPGPACAGSVSVRTVSAFASAKKRRRAIASALFSVPGGTRKNVRVALNRVGRKLIQQRKALKVVVTVKLTGRPAQDEADHAAARRARADGGRPSTLTADRARRGGSGALHPQSALVGLNSLSRGEALGSAVP